MAEDAGKPRDRGGARQDPDGGEANSRASDVTAEGDASIEGTVPVPSSSEPSSTPTVPAATGFVAPGPTVTTTVAPPLPTEGIGGSAGAPTYEAGGTPVYVGMGGRGVGGGYGIGGAYPTTEVPDPSVPLPEGCDAASRPGSETWCNLQADCTGTTWHTSCYDSQGAWSCQCSSSQRSQTFQLTGGNSSTACVKSLELCPTIDQLPLTEGECELSNASASASYCHVQDVCPGNADVGGGFTLTIFEAPSATCSNTEGEWNCDCNAGGTLVRYPVADGDPLAICSAAVTSCADSTLEFSEPMQCIPANQSATAEWCNSSSTCTQTASLGALVVEAYGSLTTSCARDGAGPWACTCAVGGDPIELELEGELGWEICTEANARCSAQLDLEDSASGGPYYGAGGASPY